MKTKRTIRIIALIALLSISLIKVNAQLPQLIVNQGNSNISDAKLVVDATDPRRPQNNEGVIIPRVERFSPDPNGNFSHGMLVNLIKPVMYHGWLHQPGFWYWDTTTVTTGNIDSPARWTPFVYYAQETGDLKHSFRTKDHHGWYLLDGRPISSLPASAQLSAAILGFTGNIPDATGKYLRQKGNSPLASVGGDTVTTILQNNLPNVNFTGTTSTNGNHHHGAQEGLSAGTSGAGRNGAKGFLMNNTQQGNDGRGYFPGPSYPGYDGDTPGGVVRENWNGVGSAFFTGIEGNHAHTVTVGSGGADKPVAIDPWHLNTNIFIYLGGQ